MMKRIVNPYAKAKESRTIDDAKPSPSRKRPRQLSNNNNNNAKNNQTTSSSSSSDEASALIISASDKAGMQGIDRPRINEIILRKSGNSKFMQQQRSRDAKVDERIACLQQKLVDQNPPSAPSSELELKLQVYRNRQAMRSTKVVVDMDMFYMACELLTKPQLHNKPACVGRGMILTSNYKARAYGVRSAMPGFVGDALVKELSNGKEQLIHVPSNFDLYKEKSKLMVSILQKYDPRYLKAYSLDEVYLDIGPYLLLYLQQCQHYGKENANLLHQAVQTKILENATTTTNYMDYLQEYPPQVCHQSALEILSHLRQAVREATGGLTCSAGIAPNFGLAKIASDKNKPNGQLLVDPCHVQEFISPLTVRQVPGIGRVTEKILNQVLKVKTVKDLFDQRGLVEWLFQPATGEFLLKASVGCFGDSKIESEDEDPSSKPTQKGISRERTFASERSWPCLLQKLQDIATILSTDMMKKNVMAHTVTVKVKLHTFHVYSRVKSLPKMEYVQSFDQLYEVAQELLVHLRQEILDQNQEFHCRLLGIRCSGLLREDDYNPQKPMDKFIFPKQNPATSAISPLSPTILKENDKTPFYKIQEKLPLTPTSNSPCVAATLTKVDTASPTSAIETTKQNNQEDLEPIDIKAEERNICPLCQIEIVGNNLIFNRHIDTCLNASTVRQMVQSSRQKGQRTKLIDFW